MIAYECYPFMGTVMVGAYDPPYLNVTDLNGQTGQQVRCKRGSQNTEFVTPSLISSTTFTLALPVRTLNLCNVEAVTKASIYQHLRSSVVESVFQGNSGGN